MVGTPSEVMESSRLELPKVDNVIIKQENITSDYPKKNTSGSSSTLIQDAWNMTSSDIEEEKYSVSAGLFNNEPQIITAPEFEIYTEETHSNEILEDMISEEIVITSDDLSLYDACDALPEIYSVCSDADTDERNSDQGYESIDSPLSDVDNPLPELFPELVCSKSSLF